MNQRSGKHRAEKDGDDFEDRSFGPEYPLLHARGAMFFSDPSNYGPEFNTLDGGSVNPQPETAEVVRILDQHWRKAASYRTQRTWIVTYLTDEFEAFRDTVGAIEKLPPPISPFEQFHLADRIGRLVTIT